MHETNEEVMVTAIKRDFMSEFHKPWDFKKPSKSISQRLLYSLVVTNAITFGICVGLAITLGTTKKTEVMHVETLPVEYQSPVRIQTPAEKLLTEITLKRGELELVMLENKINQAKEEGNRQNQASLAIESAVQNSKPLTNEQLIEFREIRQKYQRELPGLIADIKKHNKDR